MHQEQRTRFLRDEPSLVGDAAYTANLSTEACRRDHHQSSRHRQRLRPSAPTQSPERYTPPVMFSVDRNPRADIPARSSRRVRGDMPRVELPEKGNDPNPDLNPNPNPSHNPNPNPSQNPNPKAVGINSLDGSVLNELLPVTVHPVVEEMPVDVAAKREFDPAWATKTDHSIDERPTAYPDPFPSPSISTLRSNTAKDDPGTQWTDNPLHSPPWRRPPRPHVPRKAPVQRMRALRERLQSVTVPAVSHPLDDSGEEEDGTAEVLANSEPPPFKLRPEVSPSRSQPAACPASVAASTPGTSRKRTGKPRSRMPKTTRERTRHEAEIPRLGGKPPDLQATEYSQ